MTAVVIVVVQPARERGRACLLGAVDANVSPFLEQRAVEALDLAVGLGPVGARAAVADAGGEAGAGEVGAAVGGVVVGEHRLRRHATVGEPRQGAPPERHHGDRPLVGQYLAVGEAGVVVVVGVDVGVPDPLTRPGPTPAVCTPASARGYPPQLLDIHVEQVSGMEVLIAPDHPAGGPVEPAQPLQAETAQHAVDGRGGESESVADADRPDLLAPAETLDAPLQRTRCPPRAASWTAGTVLQPGLALSHEPAPPAMGRLAGHSHLRSDMGDRPA